MIFQRDTLPDGITAREYWHDQHVVWPLERTLLNSLDLEGWKRRPLVHVPANYKDPNSTGVVFWFPPWKHADQAFRKQVVALIAARLDIKNPQAKWTTSGPQPRVVVRPTAQCPTSARWSDALPQIRAASSTAPLVGLTTGGRSIVADLEADSPHIAVSGGSGSGKSVLVKCLLCQALNRGAGAVILDFKRSSHPWALGLPGVLYCRDLADIHDGLVAVGAEAQRRNVESDDPRADIGNRLFLVVEEANATIQQLQWFWEATRQKGDPKTSPAIAALRNVLFMGRSVKINTIAVAQMLTARAIGGPEARENFATRALARYTTNAWKMLAPEVWPPPKRSSVVGRWELVKGGQSYPTQVVYATDAEAREWAMQGRSRLDLQVRPSGVLVPSNSLPTTSEGLKQLETVPGETHLGLRDAQPLLPGPEMSLAALRKASQRDPRFPQPDGYYLGQHLYDIDEMTTWKARRDAAQAVKEITR